MSSSQKFHNGGARFVITVYSLSQWPLARETIARLSASNAVVTLVSFSDQPAVNEALARETAQLGAPFVEQARAVGSPVDIVESQTPWAPNEVEQSYRTLLRGQIAAAANVLRQVQAQAVIVLEDGPGGNAPMIRAAKDIGLPVLVTPFGIGEAKDYDVFIEDRHVSGGLNIVPQNEVGEAIRTHAKHWIRATPFGDVLLHPAEFVLAKVAVGLDLPQPWVVQGGVADAVIAESPAMRRHYLREGVPEAKVREGGSVYCDVVAGAFKADLRALIARWSGVRLGRTKLLIAFPPSYHASRGAHSEHASYDDLVAAVIGLVSSNQQLNVTVSIHPNAPEAEVALISSSGVAVSRDWLLREIPRHDIFLTTWSSTIRWAIAAGLPVLNYDAYAAALPTYTDVPGVFTSTRLDEIGRILNGMTADRRAYDDAAAAQRAVAKDWGVLDGQNFDRILRILMQAIYPVGDAKMDLRQ